MPLASLCSAASAGPGGVIGYAPPQPQFYEAGPNNDAFKPANGRIWSSAHKDDTWFCCGTFTTTRNAVTYSYIAACDTSKNIPSSFSWSILGNGYFFHPTSAQLEVRQLCANGDFVYVVGKFTQIRLLDAQGNATTIHAFNSFARYTISTKTWSTIGTGITVAIDENPNSLIGRGVAVSSDGLTLYTVTQGAKCTFNAIAFGSEGTNVCKHVFSNNYTTTTTTDIGNGQSGTADFIDELAIDPYDRLFALYPSGNRPYRFYTPSTNTWTTSAITAATGSSISFQRAATLDTVSNLRILLGTNANARYSADGGTTFAAGNIANNNYYCSGMGALTGNAVRLYAGAAAAGVPLQVANDTTTPVWSAFAATDGYFRSITFKNGRMYVTGAFTTVGSTVTTRNAAVYY
jgi:hypothetical protein